MNTLIYLLIALLLKELTTHLKAIKVVEWISHLTIPSSIRYYANEKVNCVERY